METCSTNTDITFESPDFISARKFKKQTRICFLEMRALGFVETLHLSLKVCEIRQRNFT